jgi:ATP-dependent DNA helicase RecG
MSQTGQEKVPELTEEELALPLEPFERLSVKDKKNRRRQAIVSLMSQNSHITSEEIAEKLDTHERTIKRDIKSLRENGVIERIGGDFGGEWKVCKKK